MVYVDRTFKGCLRQRKARRIIFIQDFFQMRSNLVYMRTCPLVNFILEGISKAFTLLLVALVLIIGYDYNYDVQSSYLEAMLIVMIVSGLLHEIGELIDSKWNAFTHFEVSMFDSFRNYFFVLYHIYFSYLY